MRTKNSIVLLFFIGICAVVFPIPSRVMHLGEKQMGKIYLELGRTTILSFPMKPNKVILGNKGAFALEYVDNDLAIAPLSAKARTNLFVYIEGRRFSFDLEESRGKSDEMVVVRDALSERKK